MLGRIPNEKESIAIGAYNFQVLNKKAAIWFQLKLVRRNINFFFHINHTLTKHLKSLPNMNGNTTKKLGFGKNILNPHFQSSF